MTDNEIEQAEKELCEIEKMHITFDGTLKIVKEPLVEYAEKYGIHIYNFFEADITQWTKDMLDHCHTFLQTKMMLNACISARESGELAKRSCKWAAIAASLALLCTIGTWVTVILMLRGE